MKTFILIFSLFIIVQLHAQTPLIAHKSHSGSAVSYFIDPNANFGEVQFFPENFRSHDYRSLNDSLILRETTNGYTVIQIDTLVNGQGETLESFIQEDLRKMQIIQDSIQKVQDSLMMEGYKKLKEYNENDLTPINSHPKNNNNPPFLLVLFGVSAILMILVRIVIRERKPLTVLPTINQER